MRGTRLSWVPRRLAVVEARMMPLNRTGQVWEDSNPGTEPAVQRFLVVGPADVEQGDTYVHPILNLDTGEIDTWFEFDMMPWEDECEMTRLL